MNKNCNSSWNDPTSTIRNNSIFISQSSKKKCFWDIFSQMKRNVALSLSLLSSRLVRDYVKLRERCFINHTCIADSATRSRYFLFRPNKFFVCLLPIHSLGIHKYVHQCMDIIAKRDKGANYGRNEKCGEDIHITSRCTKSWKCTSRSPSSCSCQMWPTSVAWPMNLLEDNNWARRLPSRYMRYQKSVWVELKD